jgi:hypothetical protein
MAYAKGENGNKGGRPKYSGEWGDALRKALHEEDPKTRKIKMHLAARKLVDKALDGDVSALKEIGDRIDGKATQPLSGDLSAAVYHIITGVPREDDGDHNPG